MKVSEALQILQSVHPDSEVTIRLGKVMPKAEPYTPVPVVGPTWSGPYYDPTAPTWPRSGGTITMSSTDTMQ